MSDISSGHSCPFMFQVTANVWISVIGGERLVLSHFKFDSSQCWVSSSDFFSEKFFPSTKMLDIIKYSNNNFLFVFTKL